MRRPVLGLLLLMAACGGGGGSEPSPAPAPLPAPAPAPTAITWAQVKTLIDANCAKCHDGTKEPLLTPEAVFRASPAKAKLGASTMPPPPLTIAAADRQTLLDFLGQK